MKYASAILTLVALAGSAWAIATFVRQPAGPISAADASAPALDQQLKSSEAELLHLRRLDKALDQVGHLTTSVQSREAMLTVHVAPTQAIDKARPTRPAVPEVSLVFVSPDLKHVVINDMLLGIGDTLAGRGQLVEIALDRIVLERHGHRSELRVPVPIH